MTHQIYINKYRVYFKASILYIDITRDCTKFMKKVILQKYVKALIYWIGRKVMYF